MVIDTAIELPDQGDNIIRAKDIDFPLDPRGAGYELYTCLRKNPDAIAQKDADTEETDTYEAYTERIVRVALHLRKRNVTPDDVVVTCTKVHLNAGVIFTATILSGAKLACLDPYMPYADAKAQMNTTKPRIMFVSEDSVEKIESIIGELNLKTELVVFGETEKHAQFSEFLKPFSKKEEDDFEPYSPKSLFDTAIIIFSSGSTGDPKGFCIHHYAILSQAKKILSLEVTRTVTSWISFSQLAWGTAQKNILIAILSSRCNLLCRDFTVEKTWKYLAKYKAEIIVIPQYNAMLMYKYGNPDKIETPHLKIFGIAGGKLPQKTAEEFSRMFIKPVPIMHGYGQSETYGAIVSPKFKNMRNVDYLGDPIKGYWYKVVDPDTGKICGPNEEGELYVKTKLAMNGYYNQDASDRFDEDGYLKTGDVVYYDEEHSFFFVERCKEALRYKNYWISPTYLESILYHHPAVKIVCVIGTPIDHGDLVTAIIVKADNAEDVTEEDLVKYVDQHVTDLKRLHGGVIFVEESLVEFTPSGKIKRSLLRKKILERLGHKTD